ncbi:MAG: SMP-30/gluconolactonase/LRE family protein, partial [Nakamurella sp.]
MVRIFDPSPVTTELYQLPEGPVWDAERERVLWVDIPAGRVHEAIFTGGTLTPTRQHDFPGQDMPGRYAPSTVGAVVPAQDGSLLVATRDALVVLAPSDRPRPVARDDITGRDREQRTQPAACARRALGGPILPSGKNSRFNDGACDPAGRFLIGSMALDGRRGQEVLYRLENDRSVTELDT